MKKIWIFIAAWGLLTTAINLSSHASANDGDSTSPHVDSKFEFPHSRWATVRQTIQVHVPPSSQALTTLWIDIPRNFEFQTSKIEITNENRTISAPILRQGQRLLINFSQPIVPNNKLQIEFNGVTRNIVTQSSVYYIYGKTVDGSTNFMGEAYFPQAD